MPLYESQSLTWLHALAFDKVGQIAAAVYSNAQSI